MQYNKHFIKHFTTAQFSFFKTLYLIIIKIIDQIFYFGHSVHVRVVRVEINVKDYKKC